MHVVESALHRRPCIATALAAWALALLSPAIAAQEFAKSPRPTITRATDVIVAPPERVKVGTMVSFSRLTTATAARITAEGFQVRIFAVASPGARPEPMVTLADCDVYISVVYPIGGTTASDIRFAQLDTSWLGLSHSEKSIREGSYFLVFERTGADDHIFRLRSKDASAYFDQGFSLVVEDDGRSALAEVRERFAIRQGDTVKLKSRMATSGPGIPCYEYQRYADGASADDRHLAEATLTECEATSTLH